MMTTEGDILHTLVNKGEQDIGSWSWSHLHTLGKLGRVNELIPSKPSNLRVLVSQVA